MAKFNYRDYLKNNPLLNEKQGYDDELDDSLGMKHGKKKQDMKQRRADSENMEKAKGKRKYSGDKSMDESKENKKMTVKEFKAQIKERILAEMSDELDEMTDVNWKARNGDSLDLAPRKVGTSTVEEEMEDIDEQEDVEVTDDENIDVDIEKDVDIDDKETESDIRVKTSVPGESTEVEAVQGLLTKAQQEAEKLGDEKLLAQIGNTITYFTRRHVVKV